MCEVREACQVCGVQCVVFTAFEVCEALRHQVLKVCVRCVVYCV